MGTGRHADRVLVLDRVSLALNVHVGGGLLVAPDGPVLIVVAGAAVSMTSVREAAVPTVPAASVARTSNVCEASVSAAVV